MIKFFGPEPPLQFSQVGIGGICPNCNRAGRWEVVSIPNHAKMNHEQIKNVIVSYRCSLCPAPIAVQWERIGVSGGEIVVNNAQLVLRATEPFDFEHVPTLVAREIKEALDCLSVAAHNGFAACCRRAVQAMCTSLGAEASTKVKNQILEMAKLTALDEAWVNLALEVMLAGHDGSHPHLPEMDADRSALVLSLMQDLTYELFTRPGKVKQAAALRKAAIEKKT